MEEGCSWEDERKNGMLTRGNGLLFTSNTPAAGKDITESDKEPQALDRLSLNKHKEVDL